MPQNGSIRLILETPASPELVEAYHENNRSKLEALLNERLAWKGAKYSIGDLPSLSFTFEPGPAFPSCPDVPPTPLPDRLVYGILFEDVGAAQEFMQAVSRTEDMLVGTDALIASFSSWCPSESSPPFFATRAHAHDLINAFVLAATFPPMEGQGVNVVVVDEGFSRARLQVRHPGFAYGGGWSVNQPGMPVRLPGEPVDPDGHGTMVARNILSIAPRVLLFDFPMLPERITNVGNYMLWAHAQFLWVLGTIALWQGLNLVPGPWVFSNAWGIYDRRLEAFAGNYTNNPNHPYNLQVTAADIVGHDQVYAAGNCGLFCPNLRCGPGDRGPGRSILGANSHSRVLTVGAVRPDGLWLGYSSQGPGQPGFAPAGGGVTEKPDLCAPSHFVEDRDSHFVSTGTSAACGIAAGAVAALRSAAAVAGMPPGMLRGHLRNGARMLAGVPPLWNLRHGYGLLDLQRTLGSILGVP